MEGRAREGREEERVGEGREGKKGEGRKGGRKETERERKRRGRWKGYVMVVGGMDAPAGDNIRVDFKLSTDGTG